MWSDTYEEHLAHSAPCSSRFDGFDRGDLGRDDPRDSPDEHSQRRLSCHRTGAGQLVEIFENRWEGEVWFFEVTVAGQRVYDGEERKEAFRAARAALRGPPIQVTVEASQGAADPWEDDIDFGGPGLRL